jgi:dishevelled associated activator of morphogenesis
MTTFWITKKLKVTCDYENLCKNFCEPKKKDLKAADTGTKKTDAPQQIIKILDDKRLMNLGIVLSKVTFTNGELKRVIENFEYKTISLDMLDKVIQMAPNAEEIDKLKAFTGDTSLISNGENFCLMLLSIKYFANKLQFIKYKKIVEIDKDEIVGRLKTINEACSSIKDSQHFLSLLKLVLYIGNYLNADSAQGNAYGFNISSLNLLDGVKGVGKDKYTLLDFLVVNVKTKEPGLLNFFKDFNSLEEVLQIDQADTDLKIKEFEGIANKLTKEIETVSKDVKEEKYLNFIKDLEKEVSSYFKEITACQTSLTKEITETATYFGEDPKAFKLPEFLKLISTFSGSFKKIAMKLSADEAKLLQKKIKDEKHKKPELNKYVKEVEKMMQNVERKTIAARKTVMKNKIKGENYTVNSIKLEDLSPLKNSAKSPGYGQGRPKEGMIRTENKKVHKARITSARITKCVKDNLEHSDDEETNIENEYLMIQQPKVHKFTGSSLNKSNIFVNQLDHDSFRRNANFK